MTTPERMHRWWNIIHASDVRVNKNKVLYNVYQADFMSKYSD